MKFTTLTLSTSAFGRMLKVGRRIADLAGCDEIRPQHRGEAIQYRSLERNLMVS